MKFISSTTGVLINLEAVTYITQDVTILRFQPLTCVFDFKSEELCNEAYEDIMDFIKSDEKLLEL